MVKILENRENIILCAHWYGLFDRDWYLANNPDVAQSKEDPRLHYIIFGGFEGRNPGPNFDSEWYLNTYEDVRKAGINPLVHYLKIGKEEGRAANLQQAEFDASFYLQYYPDVQNSGMDPYKHYQQFGKQEGRLGTLPKFDFHRGMASFEPLWDTVLMVSHEATRTGAPILSLNLAQSLNKKHNVVSLLLGCGPILDYFRDASVFVAGPLAERNDFFLIDSMIDQLTKIYKFRFAIVNSIESHAVVPALAKRFIPTVSLIHELASYTRPEYAFPETVLWSKEIVFSCRLAYENAISEHPELARRSFHILPQGNYALPVEEGNTPSLVQEEATVISKLRPEGSPADMVVVLGVGTVHLRKGVELFIDCAAKILRADADRNFRFVWIGDGYDPKQDLAYSAYLADQIQRAGLQDHVYFMKNIPNIEAAYKTVDILLLSSRMDLLPNVAIEAMLHSIPVICFEKTTGIADILAAHDLANCCVMPYLDTDMMAAKIMEFMDSISLRQDVGKRLRQVALEIFDMEHFTAQLEELGLASGVRIAQEQLDASEIARSGLAQMDYYQNELLKSVLKTPAEVFQFYVRGWATGFSRRKLFPGFHPGIFLEQSEVYRGESDPLAAYIRAGQPEGPWRYEVLSPKVTEPSIPSGTRTALHIHAYYTDLLPDMLARLNKNRVRPDLFVTVPTEQAQMEVRRVLEGYSGNVVEVQIVPNRGRDIGPFLTAFGRTFLDNFDLIGHLHTKKTEHWQNNPAVEVWRLFLLENLLGGKANMADVILERMAADPSIGMIFPDDPDTFGWDKNRIYAKELGEQLGIHAFPENFLFPTGTMFWARGKALAPLFERNLDWQDYPEEPLPHDGSILHTLERLVPFVATKQGYRLVLTNVTGITR